MKSPFWIYSLTLLWLALSVSVRFFPHFHLLPQFEGWFDAILFWILNLATLLIGIVWFKEGKKVTGIAGILLFFLATAVFVLV